LCPTVKLPGLSCQGIADNTRSPGVIKSAGEIYGHAQPSRQDKVAQMRLRIKSIKELRQSEDSQPEAGEITQTGCLFSFLVAPYSREIEQCQMPTPPFFSI